MNILVAGSIALKANPAAKSFSRFLGYEIVSSGHVLLSGNRSKFDRQVARGALKAAKEKQLQPKAILRSYVMPGAEPRFTDGSVLRSQRGNWSLDGKLKPPPEPIAQADALVLVGGGEGTRMAANWATFWKIPIAPVAAFGGVAREIFSEESERVGRRRYPHVPLEEFSTFDRVTDDQKDYAGDVVALAVKMKASNEAFVIMSFEKDPELDSLYETYRQVAAEPYGFAAQKVDEHTEVESITQEIFHGIRRAAFVFADVDEKKPNIFYEMGYARALGKDVIVTTREGTVLPFDVHDVPTIPWRPSEMEELKTTLEQRVHKIAVRLGRATYEPEDVGPESAAEPD